MPVNGRRKGHQAERDLCKWLRDHGVPEACTSREQMGRDGFHQVTDILGVKGCNVEVKNRKDVNIAQALIQADDGVKVPLVVVKPYGISNPGKWWAVTYVRDCPLWIPQTDTI